VTTRSLTAALAACVGLACQVRSQVVVSVLGSPPVGAIPVTATEWQADPFSMNGSAYGLGYIKARIGARAGDATPILSLYDSSGVGGSPGNSLVDLTLDGDPLSTSAIELRTFTPTVAYTLESHTTYWVVLNESVAQGGYYLYQFTSPSGKSVLSESGVTVPDLYAERSGGNWTVYTIQPYAFSSNGLFEIGSITVPEPSEYGVGAAVGILLFAAMRRFRSRNRPAAEREA